jgi:hypothetical protein
VSAVDEDSPNDDEERRAESWIFAESFVLLIIVAVTLLSLHAACLWLIEDKRVAIAVFLTIFVAGCLVLVLVYRRIMRMLREMDEEQKKMTEALERLCDENDDTIGRGPDS